ncbi:MAG: protease inhibitor I42 family protein [Spirochaetaceae bacterium]|jgi:predicted secreted protein|nr:protease inhibitor I42 family protein [Spirochaetaceae bacterium]
MKIGEKVTLTRKDNNASTGYHTVLAKLEGFVLSDVSCTPSHSGLHGAPGTKRFTFQAIKAGKAEVQFAKFRPWLVPAEVLYEDVRPIDVEAADITGGWTPFVKVSAFHRAYPQSPKY